MIDFDEAARHVAALALPLGGETVELGRASGRILAEPVIAAVNSPWADVSTMDGYAVREADLATLPATLPVAREIFAGADDPGTLDAGQCARIFTGAPLPRGADRVVIQECVLRAGSNAVIAESPSGAPHVRKRGSDFEAGDALLLPGTLLGPCQLVVVAAGDRGSVRCWRRPRVHLITTGDELAEPGTAASRRGAIPDSLSIGLTAMIEAWGGEVASSARLGDSIAALEQGALTGCDVVVITGGASVGERDLAKGMFTPLGLELIFSKVAMKPGKPAWLGMAGGTPVLGLPGNPTSAMVTGRLFLAPLIAGMAGRGPDAAWQWRERRVATPLPSTGDRAEFVRARLDPGGNLVPIDNQDSGAQRALATADVLIRRPAQGEALDPGALVPTIDF